MGRLREPKTEVLQVAREIRERLRWVIKPPRFGSRRRFASHVGVPPTTVTRWFAKKPSSPDIASLVKVARKTRLSLNWVLLGVGPEFLGPTRDVAKLEPAVRAHVIAGVTMGGVPADLADRLVPDGDELLRQVVAAHRQRWDDYQRAVGRRLREVAGVKPPRRR